MNDGKPPKQEIPHNKRTRYSIGHCRDDFRNIYRIPIWNWRYGIRLALVSTPSSPFLGEQQILGMVSGANDFEQIEMKVMGKIRCWMHFLLGE